MEKPRWGFLDIVLVYLAINGIAVAAALVPNVTTLDPIHLFIYLFVVQFASTVLCVWLVAVVLRKGKWQDLGLRIPSLSYCWNYGIKGGVLLIVLVALMSYVLKYFQPELQMQEIEQIMRSATRLPDIIALIIAGTVLAPVSEEIFYRGMIYPVFRKYLGPAWGAVLAGLLFGLAHFDLWRAVPLAIGGAALCYIYEKSRSVLVPMIAHALWNGAMFALIIASFAYGLG